MSDYPPVLDACCGSKAFWFNRDDQRALYLDCRKGSYEVKRGANDIQMITVAPDIVGDFVAMPFPDDSFHLVVFDPPHLNAVKSEGGNMGNYYGVLFPGWEESIAGGFRECFRVLKPNGTLIFKWNEYHIPVGRILSLTPEKPLFGHRSGKSSKTHWIVFMKSEENV